MTFDVTRDQDVAAVDVQNRVNQTLGRMAKAKVAILRTTPATVLSDYHSLMNLAGYQDVVAKDADTALKVNISWHFFFPGSSTTP